MHFHHGDFSISTLEDTIFVRLLGAFNEQGFEQLIWKVKEVILGLKGKKFKLLIDLQQFEGATPEAYHLSNNFYEWLENQRMEAEAIITSNESIKNLLKLWTPHMEKHNVNFFDSKKKALGWLLR